ncbi:MAG: glycosyltransferase [Actinobacteria bacterium]|nr:glycosyltransferase [Actinomycetota bacterium]
MKVSLISTVKDAGPALEPFLESLRAQTRTPDEVVIVDGGSADGTLHWLEREPSITVISEPGANISMGRNAAIRAAAHDVIAVTDADCILSPDWLERILAPLEDDSADVAMGFYRPAPRSFFEACAAAVSLPEAHEVDPDGFMPSARSLAFRREAIEDAGGYPEWLDIGEDMYVNHRWRERGARMAFVPEALVWWPVRPDLRSTWRQYASYARGDARADMYPQRHAIRLATYTAGPLLWRSGRRLPRVAVAAGALAYARRPVSRARTLLAGRPGERAAAVVVVPALMAFIDAAKMWGYLSGRLAPRE